MSYAGVIPGSVPGTTVDYYVAAADQSGRAETLPRTAPAGYYRFTAGCAPISLTVGRTELSWTALSGATGYDVVRDDLDRLRTTAGNFTAAVAQCVKDDHPLLVLPHEQEPPAGRSFWYLVRAAGPAGQASHLDSADCDRTTPDARIDAAEAACP